MTTIITLRKENHVVVGGDGQATLGDYIIKKNVKKIKKIYNNEVITGFSGSTSDSFILLDMLIDKLDSFKGNLLKSSIELSKEWRKDKFLRKLESFLIAVDKKISLMITGNGDVMKFDNDLIAIGSGSMYAKSSAIALLENTNLNAKQIVEKSLKIAGDICIYTNKNIIIEEIYNNK